MSAERSADALDDLCHFPVLLAVGSHDAIDLEWSHPCISLFRSGHAADPVTGQTACP